MMSLDPMSTPAKSSPTQQEKGNRPGPPRRFDEHILRWVGYHGFVTVQQIVHRFWIHRGVGGKYGYRCVAKLVADGALTQRLLEIGGDNSTPRVVSLAPQGYRKCAPGFDPAGMQRPR